MDNMPWLSAALYWPVVYIVLFSPYCIIHCRPTAHCHDIESIQIIPFISELQMSVTIAWTQCQWTGEIPAILCHLS